MHAEGRSPSFLSLPPGSLPRILPYAAYMLFLMLEQAVGAWVRWQGGGPAGFDPRWLYPVKTAVVLGLLAVVWSRCEELRRWPRAGAAAAAIVAGVVVWWLWITLDNGWLVLGDSGAGYDPRDAAGRLLLPLAAIRCFGAAVTVPVMEELFWRSFILRWLVATDFRAVPPVAALKLRPFLITAVLFGLQHHLWFAGIVAGVVYGFLYVRTGNLWVPIISHAVTNAALAAWVLATGSWGFW